MPDVLTDDGLSTRLEEALGARYRLNRLVARSDYRVLYAATDRVLHRAVSVRVNVFTTSEARTWFLREAEALARLDHPAIRHVYDVGTRDDLAWRIGNWIEGEGLDLAMRRGPRPIPQVHVLARGVLGALEHAHSRGVIVRRILPSSVIVGPTGRGTLTDLRHSSHTIAAIPASERSTGIAYMAPEVRDGQSGDPASDVYTAGAILYLALTAQEPAEDQERITPPTQLRPSIPRVFDRLLARALQAEPARRYHTAWEMYEDFTSDAGEVASQAIFIGPPEGAQALESDAAWEKRLRRALGDDYELLDKLGRGGFGRVYRVRDLHLERVVALKVLDSTLTAEPEAVERFRREAQLAARLRHPHVVDIFDIGGRYGLIWYTMELIEGPNLAQQVERHGPMAPDEVMQLLREGLAALADAHRLGMVHRDIKPENMLLDPHDGLKITDFGLALALRGDGRFGGATSRSGTPQFASPEQLLGEKVDQRTDLYSLAAVAVFSLLGRPPFTGRTPHEILARQTTDDLPPLLDERPAIGPALAAVLARALRADPEARFASADEFLQALAYEAQPLQAAEGRSWTDAAARWLRPGTRSPRPRRGS